jgi:hypothetical protein
VKKRGWELSGPALISATFRDLNSRKPAEVDPEIALGVVSINCQGSKPVCHDVSLVRVKVNVRVRVRD